MRMPRPGGSGIVDAQAAQGARGEDASLVAKLADLLERAGPRFIAAARRHVALTEVKAAARAAAQGQAGESDRADREAHHEDHEAPLGEKKAPEWRFCWG